MLITHSYRRSSYKLNWNRFCSRIDSPLTRRIEVFENSYKECFISVMVFALAITMFTVSKKKKNMCIGILVCPIMLQKRWTNMSWYPTRFRIGRKPLRSIHEDLSVLSTLDIVLFSNDSQQQSVESCTDSYSLS